jgi:hypothetical protein
MTSLSLQDLSGGTPPISQVLLSDILSDVDVIRKQETDDRAMFATVSSPDLTDIRTKLTSWVAGGKTAPCDLVRVPFVTPNVCSDGIARSFFGYIEFVSGKTIDDHLATFQTALPDFEVGYKCSRTEFVIRVLRIRTSS